MNLNKLTLSEQIYQILRTDILTQKIPLGEKLTLSSLQTRFGVSSTPIREALTRLTQDGLVNYSSNIGVNVISLNKQELTELFQFMGDLDALAIIYAAKHPEQGKLRAGLDSVIAATGIQNEAWIENSDRFHLLFYDYCRNSKLKTAAETLRSQITIFSNIYEQQAEPQLQIHDMHTQIYTAYCLGNAEKAAALMRTHLKQSLAYALDYYRNL